LHVQVASLVIAELHLHQVK